MNLKPKDRTYIRSLFGKTSHVPVVVTDGDNEPKLLGNAGGWFTRGGNPISHPSAYGKKGWSNMVYIKSTLNIQVGTDWIKRNIKEQ